MKHPEFILIPVFMLADYFLTVVGAVLKERKYDNHFKAEHYELNPVWQKQVTQKKWFSPKHFFTTIVISSLLIGLMEFGGMPEWFGQGILGCLLIVYGLVIGRHLSNLLIFEYMIRKPDEISGQVTLSHDLSLSLSLYQHLVAFVPLVVIAVFSPTPFVYGAVIGSVLLLMVHVKWIRKHRKGEK